MSKKFDYDKVKINIIIPDISEEENAKRVNTFLKLVSDTKKEIEKTMDENTNKN